MIKKLSKRLLQILSLVAVSLSGCQSSNNKFPLVVEIFVSPVSLSSPRPHYGFNYILSHDGKSIWLSSLEKVDLASGELDRTFIDSISSNYKGGTTILPFGRAFDWSVDGRYLATTSQDVDTQNDVIHPFVYLTDTQEKTVTKMEEIISFQQWSPFNNRRALVEAPEGRNLWDISKNIKLPLRDIVDFRQSKSLLGNREYLWDGELNKPIAKLISQVDATLVDQRIIGISSFRVSPIPNPNPDPDAIFEPVIMLQNAQRWVSLIFDPTGQYILLTITEPDFPPITHAAEIYTEITDTVLFLINWRTKEKTELFRLSSFDPQHVIATDIAWSGDGSTILVLRKDTSPLVVKIEYP